MVLDIYGAHNKRLVDTISPTILDLVLQYYFIAAPNPVLLVRSMLICVKHFQAVIAILRLKPINDKLHCFAAVTVQFLIQLSFIWACWSIDRLIIPVIY